MDDIDEPAICENCGERHENEADCPAVSALLGVPGDAIALDVDD